MSFTTTLDLGEIGEQEVTVEFDYTAGSRGSFNEPDCRAEVEITAVKWRGLDIRSDLSKDTIDDLEQKAFSDVEAEKEQADEDRAEAHYLERWAA
jgi:hypothetical protein